VLTADELYPIIKDVAKKPYGCWSKEEKAALISSLKGVRSFDASQASPFAAAAIQDFFFEYTEWVLSDKPARYALDPYCVIFNFGAAGVPAGWAASLALMPVGFGITPLNSGSNFAYTVGGATPSIQMGNARHFCGFMMGRHPGINAWVLSTPGTLYF